MLHFAYAMSDETPEPTPHFSREQFVDQVSAIVRRKFPLVHLSRGDVPFSVRLNGQVTSLENLYRMALLYPDDVHHHVERWVVELIRAAETTPNSESTFADVRGRIFPMLVGDAAARHQSDTLVIQPLVGGLHVAYALDHDRMISYLPKPAFKQWGITVDELHDAAIDNLVKKSESIGAHAAQNPDGGIYLILFQTNDGYDASRLLLPTLHNRLRGHLGSPFVAAVPNRDILLCFRNDDETVAKLRDQIEKDFKQWPHSVSNRLLLITPDGIAARVEEGDDAFDDSDDRNDDADDDADDASDDTDTRSYPRMYFRARHLQ